MADLDRLETALINADKAGDKDAATAFATEIRKLRSGSPAKPAGSPTAKATTGQATQAPADELGPLKYAREAVGAVAEPLLSMGTGMIAKPISDIAGLAATGKEMIAPTPGGGDPAGFKRHVQESLTYEPRTGAGKAITGALSLPGELIGRGAKAAEELVAPPATSGIGRAMLGSAVKGAIEEAPGVLGAKGGAKIAKGIPKREAALEAERGMNAPKDALRKEFQDKGYRTPPEFGIKAAASGLVGKTKAEKEASLHNNMNATKRMGEEVGIAPDTPLIDEVREAAKQSQYDRYNALKEAAGPELQVTNTFRDTLSKTLEGINNEIDVNPSLRAPQRILNGFLKRIAPSDPALQPRPGMGGPSITGTIEKAATEQPGPPIMRTLEQAATESPGPRRYGEAGISPAPSVPVPSQRTPTLSTAWAMKQISDLRRHAKDDYAKRESATGDARMGIANQLENLFSDNLAQKNKALVDEFHDARTKLAQLHLLDRITTDATGIVDLQKLAALSDTAAYKGVLTGEFRTAADLAKTYKKAAQRVTGEAAQRFTVLDGLFSVGGITGALLGHPEALAPAAIELGGRLAVPWAASKGLLQNRTPSYEVGATRRALPYALPAVGAASNQIEPPPQ